MTLPTDVLGPYIVWENYGVEGWHPKSYKTLAEALCSPRSCCEWEITRKAEFSISPLGHVTVGFDLPKAP